MSQTKVKSGLISDQSITASKLDVTGNGNNGELLASNGDGSFTWTSGIATELYTDNAISNLIDGAPGALDTLNELAAALGDDANFAGTVTTALATKIDGGGTANYLAKWTDGDTIGNSIIYDNGTNVGIGTSSPAAKLHIQATDTAGVSSLEVARFAMNQISNYGDGIYSSYFFNTNTEGARIGMRTVSNTGAELYFSTKEAGGLLTEKMLIDREGNVGIGTSSPSNTTHIYKNATLGSPTSPILAGAGLRIQDSNNSMYFDGNAIVSVGAGNLEIGAATTSIKLITNGAERMIITSEGNVGIGTTAPSEKLVVTGNTILGFDGNRPVKYDSNGGNFRITPNSGGWASGYFFNQTDGTFRGGFGGYGANNTLGYFWIGDDYNDTTMVVQPSGGNVGIGTSGPVRKLHIVSGSTHALSLDSTEQYMMEFAKSGVSKYWFKVDSSDSFVLHKNGTGDFINVLSGGNVGIGTTSPSEKLQVQGKIKLSGRNYSYGQQNHHIELTEDNGSVFIGNVNQNAYLATGSYLGAQIYHINTTQTGLASIYLGADGNIGFFANSFTAGTTTQGGTRRALIQTNGDFHVHGDVIAYSTTVSDERLKDNIVTIDNALDKVCELRGVEYDWNASSRSGQHDMGVIAQEVEKVFPFIVREKEMPLVDDNTYKTVDYEKLVGVLIEAVKELKQEIETLKSK